MAKDEWVRAAMTDDMVVVELLVRIKQAQAVSTSRSKQTTGSPAIPPSWGLKQPRSKIAQAASRCDGAVSRRKFHADSNRYSPTTPLSWSGGVSPSVTADGLEESSQHHHCSRSKATATSECTSNATNTKRCRKRKTFAELKKEECSLLEERIHLRKELATLHAAFKAQIAQNENLKKIKLDLVPNSNENAIPTIPDPMPSRVALHLANPTVSAPCDTRQTNFKQESSFLIPDLNMMPSEDDSHSEALCGMR